ncbi:hypothetical protein MY04_2516 [Flammeovirga sp. MY04]|uniref:hypothetical protein n=1 Tax=Flammeovirga sp. MY04 TaxID=1191459 RepID=UPI0008252116|nr:hypothetical protein [Flammeovirga sp. MY04]ANQ49885.2 hypothetical protein MY04_2516 [Flammeovirga sp. MY04]
MNINNLTFLSVLILMMTSCMLNTKTKESNKQTTIDLNPKTIANDTLHVKGKAIVFFSINQQEYDSLAQDENSGVIEMIDDFNYYANEVHDKLSSLGYHLSMSAARYIVLEMDDSSKVTFDRLKNKDEIVGRIYSDGNNSKIYYGVATDIDILIEEQEFNIK